MLRSYTVVFGLTADPIHLGHEQAIINGVDYLRENGFGVKELLVIPVFQPNLIANKKGPIASFDQRVDMCELVAKRLSNQLDCEIFVSQVEKELAQQTGAISYSYHTVRYLANREVPASAGMTKYLFMVSADHFQGRWPKFRKWFGWKDILKYTGLLINQRPGHKINQSFIQQLKELNSDIHLLENLASVNTSSSEIRAHFYNSDMSSYLSKDIIAYINNYRLYR